MVSILYKHSVVCVGVQMYKRQKWRHPSRAQKRNHRCMPVPGSAKKKSVISYLSTERVFHTVGHRKDLSLFLTSQRMPSRYGCVHMLIQLCKYLHAVSSVGFTIDVNDSFLLPSKYRRTSLHKAYHRVFDFVKSKSTG